MSRPCSVSAATPLCTAFAHVAVRLGATRCHGWPHQPWSLHVRRVNVAAAASAPRGHRCWRGCSWSRSTTGSAPNSRNSRTAIPSSTAISPLSMTRVPAAGRWSDLAARRASWGSCFAPRRQGRCRAAGPLLHPAWGRWPAMQIPSSHTLRRVSTLLIASNRHRLWRVDLGPWLAAVTSFCSWSGRRCCRCASVAVGRHTQPRVLLGGYRAARSGTDTSGHHAEQDYRERHDRQGRPHEPHAAKLPRGWLWPDRG